MKKAMAGISIVLAVGLQAAHAQVYRCMAAHGAPEWTDRPCGADRQEVLVTPGPSASPASAQPVTATPPAPPVSRPPLASLTEPSPGTRSAAIGAARSAVAAAQSAAAAGEGAVAAPFPASPAFQRLEGDPVGRGFVPSADLRAAVDQLPLHAGEWEIVRSDTLQGVPERRCMAAGAWRAEKRRAVGLAPEAAVCPVQKATLQGRTLTTTFACQDTVIRELFEVGGHEFRRQTFEGRGREPLRQVLDSKGRWLGPCPAPQPEGSPPVRLPAAAPAR